MCGDPHLGDVGTGFGENVNRRHDQVAHSTLGLVEALLEHANAQPGYPIGQPAEHVHAGGDVARRAEVVGIIPRRGLKRRRYILHGPSHRPRVVDALIGAEPDPEVRYKPECGLVADDTGERRRDADGAALVAAERDIHLAGSHGRARTRGRAAGHVAVVVGVEGPAVVPDAAASAKAATQAVHGILADGCPPPAHPGDHGGIEVGIKPSRAKEPKLMGILATAMWSL